MKAVYQRCAEHSPHRYLAEYDLRYNQREKLGIDDRARTYHAPVGITGKRLTYRRTDLQ